MHHAQVVEEDHIAGLELDLRRAFHSNVMQGVQGASLERCKGREGGRAGSRGCAGDASTGAVEENSAREVVWEGDGAGVEDPGGRRALQTDVNFQISCSDVKPCLRVPGIRRGPEEKPHLIMTQS